MATVLRYDVRRCPGTCAGRADEVGARSAPARPCQELGNVQDQRVTPLRPSNERNKRRTARYRCLRAIRTVLSSLQLEAEEHPEAQLILDRVAGVQAEVRRRLRASNGNAPDSAEPAGADRCLQPSRSTRTSAEVGASLGTLY